jgi:hypothetical protein
LEESCDVSILKDVDWRRPGFRKDYLFSFISLTSTQPLNQLSADLPTPGLWTFLVLNIDTSFLESCRALGIRDRRRML